MFEVRSNTNTTLRCAFEICRQQRNSFKKFFKLLIVNSVVYIAFCKNFFLSFRTFRVQFKEILWPANFHFCFAFGI